MSGQEKFDSCKHRPDDQIEIFDGCPCKKIKKLVYKCDKRNIVDLRPEVCEGCDLYEQK